MKKTTSRNPAKKTASKTSKQVPLAIVGMGCLFPKADTADAYWANITNKVDGISDIPETHWRPEDYYNKDPQKRDHTYARRGGFISRVDFNPMEYGISPRDIDSIDTTQLLGMVVAKQALDDAGYGDKSDFNRKNTSVILGITGALELVVTLGTRLGFPVWRNALEAAGVDDHTKNDVMDRISDSYVDWQENSFPGLLGNVAAGRIANRFDLGGTNCVVDAACASSLTAFHLASLELAAGRADMVVTGGMDTFNDIFMYMCFSKTPALSPTGNSKPFAANADGTILGEGLGAVILKRLDDAERDNDKIYAVIKGIGSSSDGKGNAVYAPSSEGQSRCLREAYELADINPDTIELVEAHGTGTKVGDAVEVKALSDIYRSYKSQGTWCALGSVKSQIGHTKAAAGVAGVIKAALALYHKVIPPTIKVDKPLELIESGETPFYINCEQQPWLPNPNHPRRAAVSAFGFGGSNFHCVMEEAKSEKQEITWDGDVQILGFSAENKEKLIDKIKAWPRDLNWKQLRRKSALSRKEFKTDAKVRLMMVIEKQRTDISKSFTSIISKLQKNDSGDNWNTPDGIYFFSEKEIGKLGFIFPGQGAQYLGMLRDLACKFPQFQKALSDANNVFSEFKDSLSNIKLSDLIYPQSEFTEEAQLKHESALRDTKNVQPAIGAVSLGVANIFKHFSISPDAVAGHSYGELTALCVAGKIREKALHKLSNVRGQLMAETEEIKSAMLAVRSSVKQALDLIKKEGLNLVIANKNAPEQTVLSGALNEIEKAAKIFTQKNITNKKLNVSAAFHSEWVSHASKPFREVLEKISFNTGKIPVYANTTAKPYPKAVDKARQILAEQISKPVEFIQQIENMYTSGVRTFLEVGPGNQLSGLINSILKNRECTSLALDSSRGRRSGVLSLAMVLAQLASMGYAVHLDQWDEGVNLEPEEKSGFVVALCGANSFEPKSVKPPKPKQTANLPISSTDTFERGSRPNIHASDTGQLNDVKTMNTMNKSISVGNTHLDNPMDNKALIETLKLTQQNMVALQQLQTNTSKLHSQFLQGQQEAQQTLNALISQQQHTLNKHPPGVVGSTMSTGSSKSVESPPTASAGSAVNQGKPVTVNTPDPEPVVKPDSSTPSQTSTNNNRIKQVLLSVVSEKTGYPVEMLTLDMGLDSDLGIDSIKRVEILSSLQEALPDSPAAGPEHLGTLRTLEEIVEFLGANSRKSEENSVIVTDVSVQSKSGTNNSNKVDIASVLISIVSEKTGYPEDMLTMDMGLDSDLGVDSIKRVEILSDLQDKIPEAPKIGPEQLGTLRTLDEIVGFLAVNSTTEVSETVVTTDSNESSQINTSRSMAESVLLNIVSEKTGYPKDMLSMEMGLDSDLGIDSIKRVEILSDLHEKLPDSPQVGQEHLGVLRTLGEIVDYLTQNEPEGESTVQSPTVTKSTCSADNEHIASVLLDVVADKTGYPVDMLALDMGLDSDLGIDSIKRVEILSAIQEKLPDSPGVGPEQLGVLRTLNQIVEFLGENNDTQRVVDSVPVHSDSVSNQDQSSENENDEFVERFELQLVNLDPASERRKINFTRGSVFWITNDGKNGISNRLSKELIKRGFQTKLVDLSSIDNLEYPSKLNGLIIISPRSGTEDRILRNAFTLLKNCSKALREAGRNDESLFVTVSRLDGKFGIDGLNGKSDPMSGGLAGLSKTAHHEWSEVKCKAIDYDVSTKSAATISQRIADELFCEGPVEVGVSQNGSIGLELLSANSDKKVSTLSLSKDDVVIITGGARGVTAESTMALVKKWQPALAILGRSPEPAVEPEWLKSLADEGAIKRGIIGHSQKKMLPKEVQAEYQSIINNREVLNNLERFRAEGSTVIYRSVDIRNKQEVSNVVKEIKKDFGPVRGLIHGAGVLADRLIEDKTEEQFDLVYSTKVAGQLALLAALKNEDLKFIAMFSSSTGRYGRKGQIDYAVANEVLNKIAQQQSLERRNCRVVSVNWGPWNGGMVTPELKTIFEQENIGLIPLKAGGDLLVKEISLNGGRHPAEIVVFGPNTKITTQVKQRKQSSQAHTYSTVLDRKLTIDDYPFLESHTFNGKGVLPMSMMIEWMGHSAIHGNPGLRFKGLDQFKIYSRVDISNGEEVTIRLKSAKIQKDNDQFIVPIQLCRVADENEVVHAEADVLLCVKYQQVASQIKETKLEDYPHDNDFYSDNKLFHGKLFQGIDRIDGISTKGMIGWSQSASLPKDWINKPLRQKWLSDPLVLDVSFQLMILWSIEEDDTPSLPVSIGSYKQFQSDFPGDGMRIVIQITDKVASSIHADIEFQDSRGLIIAKIEDYCCIQDKSLYKAFNKNKLEPVLHTVS